MDFIRTRLPGRPDERVGVSDTTSADRFLAGNEPLAHSMSMHRALLMFSVPSLLYLHEWLHMLPLSLVSFSNLRNQLLPACAAEWSSANLSVPEIQCNVTVVVPEKLRLQHFQLTSQGCFFTLGKNLLSTYHFPDKIPSKHVKGKWRELI